MSNKVIQMTSELRVAVQTIKTAILQSQARAVKGVNQEQLALYYGVGRYISENTRNPKWENLVQLKLFVSVCVRNSRVKGLRRIQPQKHAFDL